MLRQTRRLPVDLTRFNWWLWGYSRPMTAGQVRRLPGRAPADRSRGRFRAHLRGPCGSRGCSADAGLAGATPSERQILALKDYIEQGRAWEQDREAQRVFKGLPRRARARLRALADRLNGRRGRRSWKNLLEIIAKDLRLFEGVSCAGARTLRDLAGQLAMSPALARKVWETYQRQARLLLGEAPDSELVRVIHERFGLRLKRLSSGRLSVPAELGAEVSPEQRERLWGEVLHWFHHAFRNLLRYRDRHTPRPWAVNCAAGCRATVARWWAGLPPMEAPTQE